MIQLNTVSTLEFCDVHEERPTPQPMTVVGDPETINTKIPGLCGSCGHVDHCELRNLEYITYHCEHYK